MAVWQKTRIGEFLFERKGKYKPNNPAIAGLQRIEKIDFSGNIYISQKQSRTNMILVLPGDFVISGINVAKGAMGIYNGDEKVKATIHYSSYTFDTNKINVEYFKRFLRSDEFIRLLKEQVRGGIKTEIKPKHILPIEIDLPDLTEQEKLLAHLQSVEAEEAELKAEISCQVELLQKLRQCILQEAIEGKLTANWRTAHPDVESASELLKRIHAEKTQLIAEKKIRKQKPLPPISPEEIPFDLPHSWEWVRLGETTFGFQYGTSTKSLKTGKIPVLRMGNLQHGEIVWDSLVYTNDEEEIEKFQLVDGDLLFNRTNSRELVGKTGLDRGQRKSIYAGYLVRFHMAGNIDPDYTNYVMNSELHRDWCNEVKTDAIGQSNINATKLSKFRFPLPPLAEQKAIFAKIKPLLALCDQLESEINANQENAGKLLQAVLSEAFARG